MGIPTLGRLHCIGHDSLTLLLSGLVSTSRGGRERALASTKIESEVSKSESSETFEYVVMRFASHASSLSSVGGVHGAKKAGSLPAASLNAK